MKERKSSNQFQVKFILFLKLVTFSHFSIKSKHSIISIYLILLSFFHTYVSKFLDSSNVGTLSLHIVLMNE